MSYQFTAHIHAFAHRREHKLSEAQKTNLNDAIAFADSLIGSDEFNMSDETLYATKVEVWDDMGALSYSTWLEHWPSASERADGLVRMYSLGAGAC
jgi:hypothetical protein